MERRALIAFLAKLGGRQNRAYLSNPAKLLAGSFPAAELLSNNTFENGLTGWSGTAGTVRTVADRVLRGTREEVTGAAVHHVLQPSANVAVTQYAPLVLRTMLLQGRGAFTAGFSLGFGSAPGSFDYLSGPSIAPPVGLLSLTFVPYTTTVGCAVRDSSSANVLPGDYTEIPWISLSRCALVDNGPNLLLQSDDFTTSWVNTRSTDAANVTAAPDGTTTADSIIEDATANNDHHIEQSVTVASSAADFCGATALKAGARTWARVQLIENNIGGSAHAFINLTTGALSSLGSDDNWLNVRAFSRDLGNGWYYVAVVARKTNSATGIRLRIKLATGDGVDSYTGNGSSNILAWRGTLAQSSVPIRLVQTTTSAQPATAQTGSALHTKGWLASTNGLLLPGDELGIITSYGSELKIATATLNSDAAGLGYLQFTPPIRGVLDDNAAIIVQQPMGRFVFTGEMVGWENEPGIITRAAAEFEETA